MPLVNCPACGRPVSVHAAACPSCGHPQSIPAPPARPDRTLLVVLGAALVVVALVGGIGWFVLRALSANAEARRHRPPEELVDYEEVVDSPAAPPVAVAPPADGTLELSEVDEQPQLLNRDSISSRLSRNYPPLLRDAGVEGNATVRLRVQRDGSVDQESIQVENATHPMFGEAASRVVERMRFSPAKVHGEPVPVWVTLPVGFQLQH
jgi:TonB family protein